MLLETAAGPDSEPSCAKPCSTSLIRDLTGGGMPEELAAAQQLFKPASCPDGTCILSFSRSSTFWCGLGTALQ